ncbi:unnamed protein product, partial [Linum tenue]
MFDFPFSTDIWPLQDSTMMTLLVCIYSRRADRWGNASLRSVDIAPAENANNGFSNSWKVYVSALV